MADLKNGIIGNRHKKLSYSSAGAVPILVGILRDGPSASGKGSRSTVEEAGVSTVKAKASAAWCASGSQLTVHAAAALGSFSCGSTESSREVVAAGAIPPLCALLYSSDPKVRRPPRPPPRHSALAFLVRMSVECAPRCGCEENVVR